MMSDATKRQNRASHPENSTWVSANAGSGKTRVLTDRVARLLLAKNDPQKILCLTYTKAAAAEMQNRLFGRLGEWAMMDDASLRAALTKIGEDGRNYNETALSRTRTHFARALETPGGLKIQTIHAFCASLLRRFPIEAGISPQFKEMEEGQAALLRASILDEMAREDAPTAFDALARHLTNEDALDQLLMDVLKNKEIFGRFDRAKMAEILGIQSDETEDGIVQTTLGSISEQLLKSLGAELLKSTTKSDHERDSGRTLVGVDPYLTQDALLDTLSEIFLTKDLQPRAPSRFPSKSVLEQATWVADAIADIQKTVVEARQRVLSVRALRRTKDLHTFATSFIAKYEAAKAASNLADFDDLIAKTRTLLSTQEMTQWVLYRIDNGIDHILVDEAQDTSPAQWSIIESLSEEFTAGLGASPLNRTLFVVGDKKQSIFGFQGADPDEFHTKEHHFSGQFQRARKTLETIELPTSFRSAAPILNLVDQVFADDTGALGGPPRHEALPDTPGRIDLWDFIAAEKSDEKPAWWEPVDTIAKSNPVHKLAVRIADQIADQIRLKTPLHTKDGTRPVKPGDYLILVRSRSRFFHILIDKLKAAGLPVAGADRMKIREQLAVRDLLSLLRFLDNELDDLSLAKALRSPLFGLTEKDLFGLAHARKGTLWESLRDSTHERATEILNDLRKDADFIRPYEMLSRILTHHGGRQNLTARLGTECEDAIDELLAQSIAFETLEAPTLGGFLYWLSARSVEIKRDMEAGRNEVRVMTVHGAKGLEAPIVIVPDTTTLKSQKGPVGEIAGQAFWTQPKLEEPQALAEIDVIRQRRDAYEYARLLYVALTRAENWLIMAGAGQVSKDPMRWYNRVETAMASLGGQLQDGVRTITHRWDGVPDQAEAHHLAPIQMEPWLTAKPDPRLASPKTISPSMLGGAHALPGDHGVDIDGNEETDGTKRGDLIHALLEQLPGLPDTFWSKIAQNLCGDAFDSAEILAEVKAVITNPEFASVFDPDALVEVPITARLDELGGRTIFGRIDRLLVGPKDVRAVDFKSNLIVPKTVADVPDGILAQQAAYRAALAKIYPNRNIETAIIWTRTAEMMTLPHSTVMAALKPVTSS